MGTKKGQRIRTFIGADGKEKRLCYRCLKVHERETIIDYISTEELVGDKRKRSYCQSCIKEIKDIERENQKFRDARRRLKKQKEIESVIEEILPEFVATDTQTPTRQAANVLLSLIDDNVKQLQIDTSIELDAVNDGLSGIEADIEEIKKGISELREIFIRELCSDKVSPEIPKQIHILSQAKEKNILDVIEDAGEYGIAKSEITAKSPYVGADARDLILKKLVQNGIIEEEKTRSEINGGRKTMYYYVASENKESA